MLIVAGGGAAGDEFGGDVGAAKNNIVDATRGLDLSLVDFVVVFDAFVTFSEHFHAVGRCGRGINHGASFLFSGSSEIEESNLVDLSGKL